MEIYFFKTIRVVAVETEGGQYLLQTLNADKWITVQSRHGGHVFGDGSALIQAMKHVLVQFVRKNLWWIQSAPEQMSLDEADMALRRFYHETVLVLDKAASILGEVETEACLEGIDVDAFDGLR